MSIATYDTDAKAIIAKVRELFALTENDVLDIGALDPREYTLTALNTGGDERAFLGWVRFAKVEEGTTGKALVWADEYSLSLWLNETNTFADCLAMAHGVRKNLDGFQYRSAAMGGGVRRVVVGDAVPGFGDDFSLKTVQIFLTVT